MAAVAAYLAAHWRQIPPSFPVHWGANGVANGWATRSFFGVYGALLIATALCIFLGILGWATLHWAPHDSPHATEQARSAAVFLLIMAYLLALVFSSVAFMPLHLPAPLPVGLVALLPLLLVFALAKLWRAQPPHEEEPSAVPTPAAPAIHRDQDQFWTAACFYKNPDDPAVVVPKRYGVGYTLTSAIPRAAA